MASTRWYLVNGTVDGWQELSTATQAANPLTAGWVVGTGTTNNSEHQSGAATDRASTTFTGTTVPDGSLDTSLKDAFRTTNVLNGTFASANWSFQFAAVSPTQGGAHDGAVVFRIIKADALGGNAVEITSAQQTTSTVNNVASSPDSNSTLTFNPGSFSITNQYLFIQVAWKRIGAGGMTTTNIRFRTGSAATPTGTSILSSDFTNATVTTAFISSGSTANAPSNVSYVVNTAFISSGSVLTAPTVFPPSQSVTGAFIGGQLTQNLISFWELEETSGTRVDSHGSNDLTDHNSVGSATGIVGTAADFERDSTQYLDIASNSTLQSGDIDFTIQAWINLESKNVDQYCVTKWGPDPVYEYAIGYSTAADRFFMDLHSGSFGFALSDELGAVSTGVWYHIIGWHDSVNNQIGIAVNAGTPDITSWSVGTDLGGGDFVIGSRHEHTDPTDGLIDQVGFWKRVLTSGERDSLYNSGAGLSYAAMTSSGATTFAPTVSHAAGGDQAVTGGNIAAGSALTAPTVAYEVNNGTITSTVTVTQPDVALVVTQATIASTLSMFQPEVAYQVENGTVSSTLVITEPSVAYVVVNGTIASGVVLTQPDVVPGDVGITGGTITSTATATQPDVSLVVTQATIASTLSMFQPTVTYVVETTVIASTLSVFQPTVAYVVSIDIIASTLILTEPTVAQGGGGDQSVTGGTIASSVTLNAPSAAYEINNGTIASTLSLTSPAVAYEVNGATIASTLSLFPPTIVAAQAVTTGTINSTETLFSPTVSPEGSFSIVGAGGAVLGGTADLLREQVVPGSGTITLGGSVVPNMGRVVTGSGTITLSGTGGIAQGFSITGAGGLQSGGTITPLRGVVVTATGNLQTNGAGNSVFGRVVTPAGGVVTGGMAGIETTGGSEATFTIVGSGTIVMGGSATISFKRSPFKIIVTGETLRSSTSSSALRGSRVVDSLRAVSIVES